MRRPSDVRAAAARLFDAQHPGLRRLNHDAVGGHGEQVLGEVPVRAGEVIVISVLPPTANHRAQLVSLRNFIVDNNGERHPTRFGVTIPADAFPRFLGCIAEAAAIVEQETRSRQAGWQGSR
jgi:hypothetical protein